ncbi:Histone-lysine N-methyltransferase setdb2, partial [Blyttiomyces sp. JEL0837]
MYRRPSLVEEEWKKLKAANKSAADVDPLTISAAADGLDSWPTKLTTSMYDLIDTECILKQEMDLTEIESEQMTRMWSACDADMEEPAPPLFQVSKYEYQLPERKYITENEYSSRTEWYCPETSSEACDCASTVGACSMRYLCKCLQAANGYAYELELLRDFAQNKIWECLPTCKCSAASCQNRVVGNNPLGIEKSVQVFPTRTKGWGVKTMEDVERGGFIGEYVGYVVPMANIKNREMLHSRCEDMNLITLRRDDKEPALA